MHADRDPQLARLFAHQNEPLPATDFMAQLERRLQRAQRKHRVHSVSVVAAILAIAVIVAPSVMQVTSVIIDLTAAGFGKLDSLLLSPIAWLVIGSLAVALAPLLYVWRTLRG